MKTFQEIFSEIVSNDFATENVTVKSPEERAAKEYAKQWVEEAAMLASSTASMGGDVVNTTLELLKEIDVQ